MIAVLSLTLPWRKWRKRVEPSSTCDKREGGIGLIEKLKAYNLQDDGLDTFQANESLGHQRDARRFDIAGAMLRHLGWNSVRLLTNNPDKVYDLEQEGIKVVQIVPIEMAINEHNEKYLKAKAREARGGHSRA